MKINAISDVHKFHFGKIISRNDVKSDPQKLKAMIEMPSSLKKKNKKEPQAFIEIIKYLSTAVVCEALRQLTSVKTEWSWNATFQKLIDKAKSTIKADAYHIIHII